MLNIVKFDKAGAFALSTIKKRMGILNTHI